MIFALLLALASPEERALAYLLREVPAWPEQNRCFSCHNNGDAARALFAARRLGYAVPGPALASTLDWLRAPRRWDSLPGDPVFSDKRLARIQFASALADAVESGVIRDRRALVEAAESLLPLQHRDGFWGLDGGHLLGNPVTYGIPLATHLARRALTVAGPESFRDPIRRAADWLSSLQPGSVVDAAAVLLALGPQSRPDAVAYLLGAQGSSGGWGPYPKSPAEPFDTAVAMLALAFWDRPEVQRGRRYLIETQLADGSWPETTRPPGAQSYAQRVSTTGWAALALLHSSGRSSGR